MSTEDIENTKSSESLAATVVAYRALGVFKSESREAMIELMQRKKDGDEFDYEKYISEKTAMVPSEGVPDGIKNFLSTMTMMGAGK